jgi:uncharacterized protein (TIGR02231 family)
VIVILLEIPQPTNTIASLHYNVFNCGWAPNYDLVAENIAGKIDLKYKAKVFNNTGNDWNNVEMVLSTGDPKLSASAPLLNPWYLQSQSFSAADRKYEVPAAQSRADKYGQNNSSDFELSEGRLQNQHTGTINRPQVEMRQIEVSELSTEFNIIRMDGILLAQINLTTFCSQHISFNFHGIIHFFQNHPLIFMEY